MDDLLQQAQSPISGQPVSNRTGQLEAARAELDAAIAAIQTIPGYEDFFKPPTFAKIQQAATAQTPLVYLLATLAGGLALIVTQDGVEGLPLDFDEDALDALLFDQEDEGRYLSGAFGADVVSLHRSLAAALPLLGEKLMAPLAAKLAELGADALTLIPAGRLGLLPLHAAPISSGVSHLETFGDRFAIAYAPSAQALLHNRERHTPAARPFLAVGDPQEQVGATVDPALIHLQPLLRQVSEGRDSDGILSGSDATVAAVREELKQAPAHLLAGCHGIFDLEDPLESGLELFGGRLTVGQLIGGLRLQGTELVTLCACQSSLSDFRNVPDEAVGLPAGFLQAGAQAVIGTLWPVATFPTVLLLQHFYDLLAANVPPARALPQAVAWLRDLSAEDYQQARAKLLEWADDRAAFLIELLNPRDLGEQPFADPMYWAAFTYTGSFSPGGDSHV